MSFIRDAPLGQVIRWITKNKVLRYPEEMPDFVLPESYQHLDQLKYEKSGASSVKSTEDPAEASDGDRPKSRQEEVEEPEALWAHGGDTDLREPGHDLEKAITQQSHIGSSIAPTKTKDGIILVDWYTSDDKENPYNWSTSRKVVAATQLYLYTVSVYLASSIVTPSFPGIIDQYGVTNTEVSLLLAGFVIMYGLGSLLWSPLSELPSVGRNPPYMVTFALYVCMSLALPLVQSFPALVVLRFIQGFFGAPCLATGGASLADMFAMAELPFAICFWAVSATAGPSLGPLIAGYSVVAENWRWSFWEILWLAGPVFVSMFMFLPETYGPNILLRKAQRLRKLTGNDLLQSQSELDQANMSPRAIAFEAIIRPFQLNILDPAIAFTTFFVALLYGIYYSFFESFPIVFERYNFDSGDQGLAFLSIAVAVVVAVTIYILYLVYKVNPDMAKNGPGEPEHRLLPALVVAPLLPIGLFIFAWTSNGVIHWIVPIIGIFIFTVGVFILIQVIFVYLPWVYPQYAASLFAANNAARSSLAFAAILFSTPMFEGIGVNGGVSLLAGMTCVCCVGIYVLYFYGKVLRSKSRFSAKY